MEPPPIPITPAALAVEFSRILPSRIGADGVLLLARHAAPAGGCSVCSAVETCDALMALRGAYATLAGCAERDVDVPATSEVFRDALLLAHSVGFSHKRIRRIIPV